MRWWVEGEDLADSHETLFLSWDVVVNNCPGGGSDRLAIISWTNSVAETRDPDGHALAFSAGRCSLLPRVLSPCTGAEG